MDQRLTDLQEKTFVALQYYKKFIYPDFYEIVKKIKR